MSQTEYVPSPSAMAANQVELYEQTDGEQGRDLRGVPCVILTTIGRKSGAIRKSPLMRVNHGDQYAVVASMGGAPKHPVWYLNLEANPQVKLRDMAVEKSYLARTATGAERAESWARAVEIWPDYAQYATRTDRTLPVVVLDPVS